MDPLSIAASVVAVLGAARRLSKGVGLLKAAKGAPESLDDLLSHLASIEEVLQAIQDVSTEPSPVSPGLTRVLGRTKAKFVEMDSLIQYTLTEAGESSKVDRWQWLRKRDEVAKLQRQLDALRNDLTALISTQSLATLQRTSIHTEESWAVQQGLNHSLTERMALSEAAFAFLCNKIEESSATQRELTRVLGEFRVTQLKPAIDQEAIALAERMMKLPEDPEMRPRMRSRSELRMQTLLPLRKCLQGCPCVCRKLRRIELPSRTSALFGSGSLGFRGLRFWRTDCNHRPCKQGLGPLIVINYFLPTWIARTMLYAWFSSAPLSPPELLIRIYQVLPYRNLLSSAVRKGDLETLQENLTTGKFSPYVLCGSEGHSLLHLAAASYSERTSVILRFLLSIGLDPQLNNSSGISAAEYAIHEVVMADTHYRWRAKPFTQIDAFTAEVLKDACENTGFSEIHKIVWGISYSDLDTKIRDCPEALDELDSYGYTPLDYAIRFGKSNHVRVLLSHGADIKRRPRYLFWTVIRTGDCASIRLLLDRGIRPIDLVRYAWEDEYTCFPFKVEPPQHWNEHYVGWKPAVDRLLIDYGFDLNIGGYNGITDLMACCRRRSSPKVTERIKMLLEYGVDFDVTDNDGQTAIHHALRNDNLPALEMLIKYGARLDARTAEGETILHMAVKWIDELAMVHALSKAGIMRLDLDAPRHDGKIAFHILRCRAAGKGGWYTKFPPRDRFNIEVHIQIIRAFESLFQEIQEHQGVPLKDRYPALPIAALSEQRAAKPVEETYPASSDHSIHEATDGDEFPTNQDSTEPICAPPGAWPE